MQERLQVLGTNMHTSACVCEYMCVWVCVGVKHLHTHVNKCVGGYRTKHFEILCKLYIYIYIHTEREREGRQPSEEG